MSQLHEMKVIILTTGGLTDVRTFFFGSTANNCCEKSAEVIVEVDTSLKRSKKNQEVSQNIEGLNFTSV